MTDGAHDGPKPYQAGGGAELMPDRRGQLLELLAVLLTAFGANLFLFAANYEMSGSNVSVVTLVAGILANIGWCLLVPILLARRQAFDWKLPRTGGGWAKEFGWGALLMLAIFGCTTVVGVLAGALGLEEAPTHWSSPLNDPSILATFCVLTPIVGLSEELLFRVYVQTRLTQIMRGNWIFPVIVGSCLFAAAHVYDLVGTLSVLTIGAVLGISYQANGKIPRLVVAHILNNLIVALL